MAKLQANVSPHPFAYTRRILENQFGTRMADIFCEFGEVPIGVGAVAQVYKARLATGDRPTVAVKILHPNARALVELDLKIMYSVAWFLDSIIPDAHWLSLPDEIEIFSTMMHEQLDLAREGRNLTLFKSNFEKWHSVAFPDCFSELTSRDVLVEEWIDAVTMGKFLSFPSCFDKQVALLGLTSFLKMLILDNHLHADLHPGNIFVTFEKGGKFIPTEQLSHIRTINTEAAWRGKMEDLEAEGYSPFLYFIDAGLCTSLSPMHLNNFIDLFKAITEFNGPLISSLMVSRSKTPKSVIDFDGFADAMQGFMTEIKKNTLAFKHMEVAEILGFVLATVRHHHVKLDGEFANIAVACLLMEGMGSQLDPDMDLLKASIPFLSQAIKLRMKGNVSSNERDFWSYFWGYWLKLLNQVIYL